MTTITVTIDGADTRTRCDCVASAPKQERKYAAMVLAGLDTILTSMETGALEETVADLIRPTINQRLAEAKVEP